MPEIELYPAVKRFLERAGFVCKGEVCGCDIVAVGDGATARLAIVELKLGFNLDLLLQAVDRSRAADEVWLAVPATRRGRDRVGGCIDSAGCSASVCSRSMSDAIGSRSWRSPRPTGRGRTGTGAGSFSASTPGAAAIHRAAARPAGRS